MLIPLNTTAQLNLNNHELIIKAYQQYNEHQNALDYIDKLDLSTLKSKDKILTAKAQSLYATDNIPYSTEIFLQLNEANKKHVNYELAQCYSMLNKESFALKYLEFHLMSTNKKHISHIKSDEAFQNIKDSESWIELWNKDWYSKSELRFADADYEYRHKNYDEAQEILDEILVNRKSMHQAFHLKAIIYAEQKDYESALYPISQACKLKPRIANYQYLKADYEYHLGKINKAQKSLNVAYSRDSISIDFYSLQAQINMALKNDELAILGIKQVNNLIDNERFKYIAAQLSFEARDYIATLKYLNACIKNSQAKTEYYSLRAKTYYESGVFQYAEKDYSFLLDYEPMNGELYANRGLCRQKQGNLKGACSDWHKARTYQYIKVDEYLEKHCR